MARRRAASLPLAAPVAVLAVLIAPSCGASIKVTPSVELRETYSDNPGLRAGDAVQGQFISELTPSLRLAASGPRLSGFLSLSEHLYAYSGDRPEGTSQSQFNLQATGKSRLISDLLDVSGVSNGKLRLERRAVEMARLIDEVVEAFRPAIDLRLQHFRVLAHLDALPVFGDPLRLSQVLRNLLDNASKYTPQGGEIKLSAQRHGDALVITVSDTGIGISTRALRHIFEPFVQDAEAIAFDGSGLGLGLTVVRELVTAHGGQVDAHSAGPGRGSEFRVTLPLVGTQASPDVA